MLQKQVHTSLSGPGQVVPVSPRWVGIVSEDTSSAKSPAPNLSLSRTQFKTKQDPFPFPFPRFRGDSDLKGGPVWYGDHGGVSAGTAGGNPAEQRPIRVFSASGPGRKDQDWARRPQEKLSKAPRGGAWNPVRLAAGGRARPDFSRHGGCPSPWASLEHVLQGQEAWYGGASTYGLGVSG